MVFWMRRAYVVNLAKCVSRCFKHFEHEDALCRLDDWVVWLASKKSHGLSLRAPRTWRFELHPCTRISTSDVSLLGSLAATCNTGSLPQMQLWSQAPRKAIAIDPSCLKVHGQMICMLPVMFESRRSLSSRQVCCCSRWNTKPLTIWSSCARQPTGTVPAFHIFWLVSLLGNPKPVLWHFVPHKMHDVRATKLLCWKRRNLAAIDDAPKPPRVYCFAVSLDAAWHQSAGSFHLELTIVCFLIFTYRLHFHEISATQAALCIFRVEGDDRRVSPASKLQHLQLHTPCANRALGIALGPMALRCFNGVFIGTTAAFKLTAFICMRFTGFTGLYQKRSTATSQRAE